MSVVNASIVWKMLLYPFMILYGVGVAVRNWMFDVGILPSEKFDTPIISVGNITVGGTGKLLSPSIWCVCSGRATKWAF